MNCDVTTDMFVLYSNYKFQEGVHQNEKGDKDFVAL